MEATPPMTRVIVGLVLAGPEEEWFSSPRVRWEGVQCFPPRLTIRLTAPQSLPSRGVGCCMALYLVR